MEETIFMSEGDSKSYEEGDFEKMTEISERFNKSLQIYKEKKEVYSKLCEHGLRIEEMINEMENENKSLSNRVKDLQQLFENNKKMWEKRDETLYHKHLAQEQKDHLNQLIKMEEKMVVEIQRLKEDSEHLIAKLEKLIKNNQKEKKQILTAEQEVKRRIEEINDALCKQETETKMLKKAETRKIKIIVEMFTTIEFLRKKKHDQQEQLGDFEEEQILAKVKSQQLSETQNSMWQEALRAYILKSLSNFGVKILGAIPIAMTLAAICSVSELPDNIFTIIFELLEPYGEISYSVPPPY